MAVTQITSANVYYADTEAEIASEPIKPIGSLIIAVDTGAEYSSDGTVWFKRTQVQTNPAGETVVNMVVSDSNDSVVQYSWNEASVVRTKAVNTFNDDTNWSELEVLVTSAIAAIPDDIVGLVIINSNTDAEDDLFNAGVLVDTVNATNLHVIPMNERVIIPLVGEQINRVAVMEGAIASAASGINLKLTVRKSS